MNFKLEDAVSEAVLCDTGFMLKSACVNLHCDINTMHRSIPKKDRWLFLLYVMKFETSHQSLTEGSSGRLQPLMIYSKSQTVKCFSLPA